MRSFRLISACAVAVLISGTSYAADTGIYAGASVGQAKTDISNGLDAFFDGKDTAFKLIGGYRMLDWFGVEVSYVDLGEITPKGNSAPGLSGFRLEEAGFNAFGVLYYDIATFDLFAKAGVMLSQTHSRVSSIFGSFNDTNNSTDLAWGVGGQARFGSLAVRLEYERFDLDAGSGFDSPDMVSLGATWTFF